jgi:hypothetical protein
MLLSMIRKMATPSDPLFKLVKFASFHQKAFGFLLVGNLLVGLWLWKSEVHHIIDLHLRQILSLVVVVTSGILGGKMAQSADLDPMLVHSSSLYFS